MTTTSLLLFNFRSLRSHSFGDTDPLIRNHPSLRVTSHMWVKPRKSNVSGFPSPHSPRLLAANRANSKSQVVSSWNSKPNLLIRVRNTARAWLLICLATHLPFCVAGLSGVSEFQLSKDGQRSGVAYLITCRKRDCAECDAPHGPLGRTLLRITSTRITSTRITSTCLTSPRLTSPRLTPTHFQRSVGGMNASRLESDSGLVSAANW